MIWRVSSSGRTCGRPRQRRSWMVSTSAMLLHDACHSIDSPNVGPIMENIKFPNLADARRRPSGVTVMTHHSTAFEAERSVPVGDAVKDLVPDILKDVSTSAAHAPAIKTFNFRKLLMAGAVLAVVAGAAWYGWDYWTVGQYLVSTDDAYVKADNTTIAPKVSGYLHKVLVGDNERVTAGQILARIDDRDFAVALDQAKADVASADTTIASKQAQLGVQQAVIDAAKATLEVTKRRRLSLPKRTSATRILPAPVTAACKT